MIKESYDNIQQIGGVLLDCEQRIRNADYTEDLVQFQEKLAEQHAGMFAGEFDSNLEDWAPLAKATIDRKGHDRILVETGALRESLVHVGGAGNIHDVMPRGMLFGTEIEYAVFHQEGTRRMPARPPVGVSEETLDKFVERIADSAVEKLKVTV